MCHEDFAKHIVKKVLELGCGQARDSLFFASKGLEVYAIDSSKIAIEYLTAKTREMNLNIYCKNINSVEGLPFSITTLMPFIHICFITWVLLIMN